MGLVNITTMDFLSFPNPAAPSTHTSNLVNNDVVDGDTPSWLAQAIVMCSMAVVDTLYSPSHIDVGVGNNQPTASSRSDSFIQYFKLARKYTGHVNTAALIVLPFISQSLQKSLPLTEKYLGERVAWHWSRFVVLPAITWVSVVVVSIQAAQLADQLTSTLVSYLPFKMPFQM